VKLLKALAVVGGAVGLGAVITALSSGTAQAAAKGTERKWGDPPPDGYTDDRRKAEIAAERLNNFVRNAGLNGQCAPESTHGGWLRLRLTLTKPDPQTMMLIPKTVDGLVINTVVK
jgi:hypothetical protein